ncbi:hypothetical protein Tco_1316268 [Tanacetum coccineum]
MVANQILGATIKYLGVCMYLRVVVECITVVPKADHSRNSSSFSDSKHFFCSTCHKCVFNANHDACITKLLNEVNSRKVKPHKTKNSNNPVEQKSHTQKPGRQISSGHRFSPKKTSAVYEKTSPRSCLRWIPTGRIFKLAGLRWIPTGKMFIDSTTKVDSEPPNGSNEDITNPYECDQTLNVSAGTLNLSAGPAPQRKERCTLQCALSLKEEKSSYLRAVLSTTSISSHARSVNKWINYFKPPPNVDHPVPAADSPSSTTIDQDVSLLGSSQNFHHLKQSYDTLTKLTKEEGPSGDMLLRYFSTGFRQESTSKYAIWCYFDANVNPIPFGGKQSG